MFDDGQPKADPSKNINVTLKTLDGTIIDKTLPRSSKISELIPVYLENLLIDRNQLRNIYFSYRGKNLNHDLTFNDINIPDNMNDDETLILHATHRMKGGLF